MKNTLPNPNFLQFCQDHSQPGQMEAFLSQCLSPELAESLDFSSLVPDTHDYKSGSLSGEFTDVLYEVTFKNKPLQLKIACMVGHEEDVPFMVKLHALSYVVNVWDYQSKAEEPFTVVVPVWVTRSAKGWKGTPIRLNPFFEEKHEFFQDLEKYNPIKV